MLISQLWNVLEMQCFVDYHPDRRDTPSAESQQKWSEEEYTQGCNRIPD